MLPSREACVAMVTFFTRLHYVIGMQQIHLWIQGPPHGGNGRSDEWYDNDNRDDYSD